MTSRCLETASSYANTSLTHAHGGVCCMLYCFTDGKGRGRQVIGTARTANMLLICLDAMKSMTHKKIIEKELDGIGIRLNQTPPDVIFRKKEKGGLNYQEMVTQFKVSMTIFIRSSKLSLGCEC
eukprot:11025-Heterococcus_DN1.PRE.2